MLPPHSRYFLLPIVQVYYDPQFDELRFQPRHAPELFEASSASTANSLKSTFAIFRRLCLAKPFISPGDITPPLVVKITSLYYCHPEIEEDSSRSLVRLSACRCGCQDCTGQDRLGDGRKNGTFLRGNAVTLSKQVMKYAEAYDIVDLAVFDWNALFIYDLDSMDEDSSSPILARGTFFTEASNACNV